eukprot:1975958-Alexandrium_andersonii.AAC.1
MQCAEAGIGFGRGRSPAVQNRRGQEIGTRLPGASTFAGPCRWPGRCGGVPTPPRLSRRRLVRTSSRTSAA